MQNLAETLDESKKASGPRSQWSEIPGSDLGAWTLRLSGEKDASIRQYPLFNERFHRKLARPIFLGRRNSAGEMTGFACVISLGFPKLKCAVVVDGPVEIGGGGHLGDGVSSLASLLKSRGFTFVRFSHREQSMIDHLAGGSGAVFDNPLPFVPLYGGELAVRLEASDSAMLAGFQPIARREIRHAKEAGCVVKHSSNRLQLQEVWPIFAHRAQKKGIRLGSHEDYCSMFDHSPREDLARLYTAFYGDKPVYTSVVLRSRSTAHHLIAALDEEALGSHPTPSCLLNWEAMRDYRDLGCSWYNLGGRSGSVYAFKKKFRPEETPPPTAVTLVLRPAGYRLWTNLALPTLRAWSRVEVFLGKHWASAPLAA